ncbi:MAG: HAMP domain-containing histidine kinase [Clostridiales bacterium]|nr:HAMP domain-containing histidine kinase [Clostridiales bacterium]
MNKNNTKKFIAAGALVALLAVGISSWINMLELEWWLDAVLSCIVSAGIGALVFCFISKDQKEPTNVKKNEMAKLSHELRSPLTSIKGYLFAIKDGIADSDCTDKFIDIAISESDRMLQMLENAMNGKTANTITPNMSSFDLNKLIDDVIIECKMLADNKSIRIKTEYDQDECIATADRSLIREVLINLTENAIKYGKQDGNILISTNMDEDTIFVSVKDDGKGISPKHIAHIFESGYKVSDDKNSHGIGLNIVKDILNKHSKTITVNSTYGKGTEFRFELDRADLK